MQWFCLKAVQAFLNDRLSDMLLRKHGKGNDEAVPPAIVIGVNSVQQPRAKKEYPFVALTPAGLDGSGEMDELSISLVCGVFTAEDDPEAGTHEICNLVDRILSELRQERIIDGRYERTDRLRVFGEPVPRHPYYHAEIVTKWRYIAPRPRLEV